MKPSKILRKAAEMVDKKSEDYCCHAIEVVTETWPWRDCSCNPAFPYLVMMKGRGQQNSSGWFGHFRKIEARNRRVIALLLAAEIAESEDQ